MEDPLQRLSQDLARAVQEAEAEARQRRSRTEALRDERELLLQRLRELHDQLLRLLASGKADQHARVAEETAARCVELLDRLKEVLGRTAEAVREGDSPRGPPEIVVAPTPPPAREDIRAASKQETSGVAEEPPADETTAEEQLRPVYQEILTLEENENFLDDEELRARLENLLARMRKVQDGPLSRVMTQEQRSFMTTRFGLLEGIQKRRRLGYLDLLNRQFHGDWDAIIARTERGLRPLPERLVELHSERETRERRRHAALEQAARRRLEGEEILDELRFFVRGPELGHEEGRTRFRSLVREAGSCLGWDHVGLCEFVRPYLEVLHGRAFKPLRRAARRDVALPPEVEPRANQLADREDQLKGSWAGHSALMLGGQRRERAELILYDHLGLSSLIWIPAAELEIEGPGRAEAILADERLHLAILLTQDLGVGLHERLRIASRSGIIVEVAGGQEVSRILAALPVPGERERRSPVRSVREAVERAQAEHPEALAVAFNSASDGLESRFADASAVHDALCFLATTYRDARRGHRSCPDLDLACRSACGFQYRSHQASSTMGRFPQHYVSAWQGRRYELGEHLGRGSGRDPRHSIRIAFAWDPAEQRVVVGYLGQHQRTTAT